MLNQVVMMGRLTADPELRQTQGGSDVCSFTLAVERSFAREGEERKTDFFDVTAWNKTAQFASHYFKKGQLIAVQGRLETNTYDDKNGVRRKSFTLIAEQVHFAEPKREEEKAVSVFQSPSEVIGELVQDDDLPF